MVDARQVAAGLDEVRCICAHDPDVATEPLIQGGHESLVDKAHFVGKGVCGAAVVDLEDARALAGALHGAHGAYLLIPPSFTAPSYRAFQRDVARSLAAAAAESRILHVVFLSAFASHRQSGSSPLAGLHDAERILGAVQGLRLSSIRAGYFYENLVPVLDAVKGAGVLPLFFLAELPVPMVATRDVGLLASELLLDGASHGVVELGAELTHSEIARVLGQIVGKPVRIEELLQRPSAANPT